MPAVLSRAVSPWGSDLEPGGDVFSLLIGELFRRLDKNGQDKKSESVALIFPVASWNLLSCFPKKYFYDGFPQWDCYPCTRPCIVVLSPHFSLDPGHPTLHTF